MADANEKIEDVNPNEDLVHLMSDAEREALGIAPGQSASINSLMQPDDDELEDDGKVANDGSNLQPAPDAQQKLESEPPAEQHPQPTDAAPTVEPVADLDKQLADIEAKRSELRSTLAKDESNLREKLEYGELSADEYGSAVNALRKTSDDAVGELLATQGELKARDALFAQQQEAYKVSLGQRWKADLEGFFGTVKGQLDYNDPQKAVLARLFGAEIDRINKERGDKLSNAQILAEAHKSVMSVVAPSAKSIAGSKVVIPPNIGSMPASANSSADNVDRFSDLDKLSGISLERRVAAMSEEDQMLWLGKD